MRTLLTLVCCMAPLAGAEPARQADLVPGAAAARCAALIARFDGIIVNHFDYRILMLEAYELAEARDWRHQAERACRAGVYAFGIPLIESALQRIGVVPWPADPPPDRR